MKVILLTLIIMGPEPTDLHYQYQDIYAHSVVSAQNACYAQGKRSSHDSHKVRIAFHCGPVRDSTLSVFK